MATPAARAALKPMLDIAEKMASSTVGCIDHDETRLLCETATTIPEAAAHPSRQTTAAIPNHGTLWRKD